MWKYSVSDDRSDLAGLGVVPRVVADVWTLQAAMVARLEPAVVIRVSWLARSSDRGSDSADRGGRAGVGYPFDSGSVTRDDRSELNAG